MGSTTLTFVYEVVGLSLRSSKQEALKERYCIFTSHTNTLLVMTKQHWACPGKYNGNVYLRRTELAREETGLIPHTRACSPVTSQERFGFPTVTLSLLPTPSWEWFYGSKYHWLKH